MRPEKTTLTSRAPLTPPEWTAKEMPRVATLTEAAQSREAAVLASTAVLGWSRLGMLPEHHQKQYLKLTQNSWSTRMRLPPFAGGP